MKRGIPPPTGGLQYFTPLVGINLDINIIVNKRRKNKSMVGMEYLRRKLEQKRNRVLTRYKYYESKNDTLNPSPAVPQRLEQIYNSVLGWPAKAVDSLADRIVFREFAEDNFNINEIYQMNNPDVLFRSAIHEALIGSCSFIYISEDEDGYPRLQVIDGANATGVIDPITGLLAEGYAVLERNDLGIPLIEAYFVPNQTQIFTADYTMTYTHNVNYPLLVPIIYKPDAKRPFGHSVITRAAMDLTDKARWTITRADITAEFYSFPQKYVVGLSQDAEPLDAWKATISAMLQFTKDDDGDRPSVGQFQQTSMTPILEQFRLYASAFAGETGLTLDDLGFPTANPSSSEAIKAAHENLRLTARAAQKTFGSGLLNAGYLAACLRDGFPYKRSQLYLTKPKWEPVFEPDASALSGIGDAAIKLQQSFPDYFDAEKLKDLTGI